jgi:hypothetical protein
VDGEAKDSIQEEELMIAQVQDAEILQMIGARNGH